MQIMPYIYGCPFPAIGAIIAAFTVMSDAIVSAPDRLS